VKETKLILKPINAQVESALQLLNCGSSSLFLPVAVPNVVEYLTYSDKEGFIFMLCPIL
jgi:hypothetical protein